MQSTSRLALLGALSAGLLWACGEPFQAPASAGGSAGDSGAAGSLGGLGGSGGGGAGSSGTAGEAGEAGRGGDGGQGANAGSGGSAGDAGSGASAGQAGEAGRGGSPGECTSAGDCSDGNVCNGKESCRDHECVGSDPLDDGSACDGPGAGAYLCKSGECVESFCGDGIVDPTTGEECDDADENDGNACTNDCHVTCNDDVACADGNACNGIERCVTHICEPGSNEEKGISCESSEEGNHYCDGQGGCLPSACGDGILDAASEDCEEAGGPNGDDSDGCTDACKYTCQVDTDCGDQNSCNGVETCKVATHRCEAGEPLDCDDLQKCTQDSCVPATGCAYQLIDADGDGYPPDALGPNCNFEGSVKSFDCNDNDPKIHPDVLDPCDSVNNDCDNNLDEDPEHVWYEDCDGDQYALEGAKATAQVSCTKPTAAPARCKDGKWTEKNPSDSLGAGNTTTDCVDNKLAVGSDDFYPTQSSYFSAPGGLGILPSQWDYNCNATIEKEFPTFMMTGCESQAATSPAACDVYSGWTTASGAVIPECGKSGSYTRCVSGAAKCRYIVAEAKTQRCH